LEIKRVPLKTYFSNVVFKISQPFQHRNLKILVPIPNNRWGIMMVGTRILSFYGKKIRYIENKIGKNMFFREARFIVVDF
jgi:hypothetical protein